VDAVVDVNLEDGYLTADDFYLDAFQEGETVK